MKSKLYQQRIDEALDSVPIEQGGTAARTKETACENLGLVSKDQVRGPGGIIILGEDGLISKSDLPPDILNNDLPSLFGPQDVELGATVPYYITNYASDVQYDITVSGGTFTRDVDCIFFTAQETSTQGSIQVNARTFPLWIGPPKPMRPVILTPEAGLEQGPFVKFTASDYIARKSGDLHAGSEWQVSTTIGFDVIVAEGTITELAKLKAWTSSRLERDTQYFARVRYLGSLGGVSEWSVPHLLKTRVSFIPEFYMATVGSEAYDGAVRWRSVDIDGVGDRVILGDPTVDEDPNYDTGAIRIFRRAGQDFVEEATMLDHPLSLNTEIRLQIPVGGVVEMTTDSELTGNQTYTASTVFYAPSDASYVTLVGKGTDAIETLAVKPQQGLLAYPEGLPVYNAGQAAVAETGDMYYPDGLPVYVPAQLGGVPEYPDGLPPYDPFGTDGGVWEYPDGLPPYDPAFPRIPQQGSPDYPNGLPPYDDGQAYIAPTGHPSYPNGLPPYEPAGQVYIPGDAASVSYNGQTYLFPGGQDGRATFTTVTLNFLANQSEHYFGKEVSLSKDGKVAAASGNTSVWKGLAADLKIPPGAQIEFNIFSPDPVVETYFQDSRVGIPKDAYQVKLTGKGAPGSAGTVVPAATQTLSTSGSVSIPKGIRMITASGKGGPGSVILSPQKGLPEYPNGLPVYAAEQQYIAPVGDSNYPSGLPAYNPGQSYIAPAYDWYWEETLMNSSIAPAYSKVSLAEVKQAAGVPAASGTIRNDNYSKAALGNTYLHYSVTRTAATVESKNTVDFEWKPTTFINASGQSEVYNQDLYTSLVAAPVSLDETDPNRIIVSVGSAVSVADAIQKFNAVGVLPHFGRRARIQWSFASTSAMGTYHYYSFIEMTAAPKGGYQTLNSPRLKMAPNGVWSEPVTKTPTPESVVLDDTRYVFGRVSFQQAAEMISVPGAYPTPADGTEPHAYFFVQIGTETDWTIMRAYAKPVQEPIKSQVKLYPNGWGPNVFSPLGESLTAQYAAISKVSDLDAKFGAVTAVGQTQTVTVSLYAPNRVVYANYSVKGTSFKYDSGLPYVDANGWVPEKPAKPAVYGWMVESADDITAASLQAFPANQGYPAVTLYPDPPNDLGQTVTYWNAVGPSGTQTVWHQVRLKSYVVQDAIPVVTGYYIQPGQPYIAPVGNASYPTGLPPYNAGQPYKAAVGNPAYPNGLPPYEPPGTPQVGLPEYPNGLPVYNAGQPYIAPTGNPSYPSGLTPYDPGQAYVAPTAPVYGWNTSSAYASTTPTAAYPYSTIAQVTTAFGAPSGDGQSKSSGYSIQETGTYYTQYTVTSVAYQVTAYSAGQPYIAPIATTYKWKYAGPILVRSVGVDWTDGEPVSKAQALSTFLSTNGSAPLSANSTGSYLYEEWGVGYGEDPGGYWNEWRVTVTAVVDSQGTPGQPYIAPTAATFAWGTPTITQTATGVTSNSFAVVAAAGDAMNTAGTPTAAGQTFSRNVATSYGDTQYKNYTVSATSYTVTAGSPGQPYIAPSGNPSYPGGLPAYNPGQPYIPSTGNPSYPSGLQPYSPAGMTSLMGPDSTFTINGQSYIFPGGKGTDPAIEKAYDITLPGLTALEGIFTIATGGSGKVAYENGVIPNRTIAPLNTTVTRDGSIGISRAITTLTLRGKGQDGTRTTVTAQQGLPEYPNGLPVYNAGQSYIAPAGLPAYPTGLPPYNAGQAYVAPTGDPNYPNGLPVYNAGQPYIAPTGSSSYPNGLPPYNPGQPYIAPTAAVYGWSTTETLSSTTTSPLYAYNLLSQVISTFDGKVTGNGQTKSGGYSVQEAATLYSNYSVSSVAYQATAYNPGQPYIAPKATTYKWKYAEPIPVTNADVDWTVEEPVSEAQARSTFLSKNGSAPLSANSTGSYVEYLDGYWNEWRVTVTAVVDVQGTPGQPYIAPTAATFAWGTPTVTMTATDQISTGLPVVMGVSDAMSTAGTPTYKGQTFNRSVATSYAGTVYKNYAVSGTSYTVTAATPGQVYIAPVGSSSYPSGLPTYNPGQSYIAPSGNVSYPSGLPVYNAGQPYIAPTGNPSYPSGLPPYSAGQPLIAATGNVNYPSGLPVYKPAVITTTSGQNTTFTINGQTYTFQGGQDGASATSRIETVTLPGTVDQTGVYTVPMGGSIEISHYGGTVAGNAVPALNLEIVNTGYLTLESGLTVLEVTLKGGDGEIAIVEPEQGLLQFPNGLPRYVPGSSPQVGDSRYPDGLPIYRQATAKTIKGQDSTFTINGQTYIFEGGNGQPATERTEVIQLPGTSTLTATYAVAENVIGMVKHAAYEVWISAGYPAIARINNTIYVFPGGETGPAPVTTHSVPLVSSWNVGSVSTTLRTGESWSPPSVLTPEVDQEHLFFGTSISLDGTGLRMAVSGPGYDQSKGAVWLYVREDGYWKREAFLTPKDLNANDLFGQSVCLSQDGLVLAIGAPQHQQRGAVYLYQRIQGTWYFQAKVMADDPQQTDDFGTSVSLNSDGRILAVGAPGRDYAKPVYEWDRVTEKDQIVYFTTYDNAGAAFTFQYSQGVWSQTAELRRSEAPGMPISFTNNHFGTSVSLDGLGTALVVGVPGSDYGYGGMGAVSTYIAQGPTWTFYKEVKPDSYSMGTLFARRLRMAASGQYMIANANGSHIVDGQYIQGASLVFSVEERAASTPLPPIMLS